MEQLLPSLISHEKSIGVVGLGYVGLPLACLLASKYRVLAYDVNTRRLDELRDQIDRTGEVTDRARLASPLISYTSDPSALSECPLIIVAVPTPIDLYKKPDLEPLKRASETVGKNMARGSIVVYESTVYPGLTEDVCRKVLEQASGMKYQEDFFLGYSPERINPGDKVHSLENVVKIVSASTAEALDVVDSVYRSVIKAGTHRAPSIATAEAAKIIENVQRDINIALVNELALIFERIGLDTLDVLEAAKTKWNFMPFHPGLVGGHCIGVDPYYLTYLAESLNVNPQVIASGRKINDRMGRFVGEKMIRMIFNGPTPGGAAQVAVCGMTFKENVPDLRNTKVHDLVACLEDFGVRVYCLDPLCDPDEFKEEFGRKLDHWDELPQLDGLIMAVPHETYRRDMSLAKIASRLKGARAFLDLKGIYDPREAKALGLNFWRL